MDPIVTALAAGSTSEPHFDDQDGDTDDEVAQHTDGASEGEQYDQSDTPGTFTITEYQLLHRAVFSPTAGSEELKELLQKGIDVDCTDHAGAPPPDRTDIGSLSMSCSSTADPHPYPWQDTQI
jgi:hypothetical protein|tara:strand:- start:367 stop:735 length:369 start_codon:yes stop_codon:yes gene_type:complete